MPIIRYLTSLTHSMWGALFHTKPMNTPDKTKFLELYRKAHNNALELLSEAELLFENKKYARAYFLAFTGLEEIAKSQLAADVFTGFIEEEKFWKYFKDHKKKIGRMAWASEDAKHYLDLDLETYLEIERPTITGRMNALYVHFEGEKIKGPDDHLTEDEARAIIHTLRVAIDRIIEMTDYWGHQIGTKGFMK